MPVEYTVLGADLNPIRTCDVLSKITDFFNEYLRINAIRRMLSVVTVRKTEIAGLVALAAVFAAFEGVGLSMLLPILQYAEDGTTAITDGTGVIWSTVALVMKTLHLPVNLVVLLLLAFVPILMRQVVYYLNAWYSAVVGNRIGVRMRVKTVDAVLAADPDFFEHQTVGHLVGVTVAQTEAAGDAILAVVKQLSIALLMLLYVAIMVVLSVPLTVATVVFAALVGLVVKGSIARIRAYGVSVTETTQQMYAKIVERFSLIRLVKLRDQAAAESERIAEYSRVQQEIRVKQARLGARIEVLADPLLMLSVFVTLYIGIAVLGMTLAQLGLMLFVITRLNAKVKEFNNGRQIISTKMAGLLLVRQTTTDAENANTIRRGTLPFAGLERELVIDDVVFRYAPAPDQDGHETEAKPVLQGVSVTVPAGSFTALVGKSGGGKSTLVELLPRLRDASGGRITYDGVDIRQFDVGSLRKGIGYLTQDAMLFNETVRENLVYGLDFTPTEQQIRDAVERAYATFVFDLPQGLETVLGDRGVRFSGGERQRIALARVLLEDTSVLILDEPTSALDSESEAFIQKALAALHGTKTIIVVAHRLATVIQADQLLVIDDGRVIERGTHAELIAHEGAYHRLFESQLLG